MGHVSHFVLKRRVEAKISQRTTRELMYRADIPGTLVLMKEYV